MTFFKHKKADEPPPYEAGVPALEAADRHALEGRLEQAVAEYTKLLHKENDRQILLHRSIAFEQRGERWWDDALNDAVMITRHHPDWFKGHVRHGQILLRQGNFPAARAALFHARGLASWSDVYEIDRLLDEERGGNAAPVSPTPAPTISLPEKYMTPAIGPYRTSPPEWLKLPQAAAGMKVIEEKIMTYGVTDWRNLEMMVLSENFRCADFAWRLQLHPYGKQNDEANREKAIALFLELVEPKASDHACARFQLTIWNPTEPSKKSSRYSMICFEKGTVPSYGSASFATFKQLFVVPFPRHSMPFLDNWSANMSVHLQVVKNAKWHTRK